MSSSRAMYLLSLLYPHAHDGSKEHLAALFKSSAMESTEYDVLKSLLQEVAFFGVDGEALYNDARDSIEGLLSDMHKTAQHLRRAELLCEQISRCVNQADALLTSPEFFSDELIAVKNGDAEVFNRFYRAYTNVLCYYLLTHTDSEAISGLSFNRNGGFREIVETVNTTFGDTLLSASNNNLFYKWGILRRDFDGVQGMSYSGYAAVYDQQGLTPEYTSSEYAELTPYIRYSISQDSKYLLVGHGNIVGVDVYDALSLLGAPLVVQLQPDTFRDGIPDVRNIVAELKAVLGTDAFCINVGNVVTALNRNAHHREALGRKRDGRCAMCGAVLPRGRVVCSTHFAIPQ